MEGIAGGRRALHVARCIMVNHRIRAVVLAASLLVPVVATVVGSPSVVRAAAVADMTVDPSLQVPTNICAASGVGSVTLQWDAPTDPAVTGNVVQYQPFGTSTWLDGTSVDGANSATVQGLSNGAKYRFRVASVSNASTRSEWGSYCVVERYSEGVSLPYQVSGGALVGEEVRLTSQGPSFRCAVTTSGKIVCWSSPSLVPVVVADGSGDPFQKVSVGYNHACAVTVGGRLWCWGGNQSGQLGLGSTSPSAVPQQVAGGALAGKSIIDVAAGTFRTCVVTAERTVACFGLNQPGYGTVPPNASVQLLPTVLSLAGLQGDQVLSIAPLKETMCLITALGRVACWGSNVGGAIQQTLTMWFANPTFVNGGVLEGYKVVGVGGDWDISGLPFCAITESRRLACAGPQFFGDRFDGASPVIASAIPSWSTRGALQGVGVSEVAVSYAGSCAVTVNEDLVCAGGSAFGSGFPQKSTTPQLVNWGALAGGGLTNISMGSSYLTGVWTGTAMAGMAPMSPRSLTASAAGRSIMLSWTAPLDPGAAPIDSYIVEGSADGGRSWPLSFPGASSATSLTFDVPSDDYYMFRVRAQSSIGLSAPSVASNEVLATTQIPLPRANVAVSFATPTGVPIVRATVSWRTTDGLIGGVGTRVTDAAGIALFPVLETGPVVFTVAGGTAGDTGIAFTSGVFTTVVQSSGATVNVVTPDLPAVATRALSVRMPDGTLVPDTAISHAGGISDRATTGFTTDLRSFKAQWQYPYAVLPSTSGPTGQVTFVGFDVPSTGRDVQATFTDDFIQQTAYGVLTEPTNEIVFRQMPVVRLLTSEPAPLDPGAGTTVTAEAVDGFGNPIPSAPLSVLASTSKSATLRAGSIDREITMRSTCGASTTALTGADGRATFRVCPSTTAGWRVDGSSMVASQPLTIAVKPAPTQIAAGNAHSCSRLADGSAACWGANASGQLGKGDKAGSSLPVSVPGLAGVSAVAAGSAFSCALIGGGSGGNVRCWGANGSGQLGDGTTVARLAPNQVTTSGTPLSGVTALAAGGSSTCAVVAGGSSGTLRCWGANGSGQLGDGTVTRRTQPVKVKVSATATLRGVTKVSVGTSSACALMANGAVRCWGANSYGQLGNNSTAPSRYAVVVAGINGSTAKATSIAVGDGFACARLSTGAVRCWGRNDFGQLGNGSTAASKVPVAVKTSASASLAGASRVSAGGGHACAVVGSGSTARVRCWGLNSNGQLGLGNTVNQRFAVLLSATSTAGVKDVTAGWLHTEAVVTSKIRLPSVAVAWGRNANGQLGIGGTTGRRTPIALAKL